MVHRLHGVELRHQYAYYANIWWVDDDVREVRGTWRRRAPHCIDSDGQGRYDVTNPAQLPGDLGVAVSPDLRRNTVIIYITDNGWFLPNSKHAFTENGYRTRLLVFDPRTLPTVPGWDGTKQTPPPVQRERGARRTRPTCCPPRSATRSPPPGSQACPVSADGTSCDGKDLRP